MSRVLWVPRTVEPVCFLSCACCFIATARSSWCLAAASLAPRQCAAPLPLLLAPSLPTWSPSTGPRLTPPPASTLRSFLPLPCVCSCFPTHVLVCMRAHTCFLLPPVLPCAPCPRLPPALSWPLRPLSAARRPSPPAHICVYPCVLPVCAHGTWVPSPLHLKIIVLSHQSQRHPPYTS